MASTADEARGIRDREEPEEMCPVEMAAYMRIARAAVADACVSLLSAGHGEARASARRSAAAWLSDPDRAARWFDAIGIRYEDAMTTLREKAPEDAWDGIEGYEFWSPEKLAEALANPRTVL